MIADAKTANAVGGRTARACESCLKCRARWYCPADDAFLCGACDASVHSANQLARRHERVRLEAAPNPSTSHKSNGRSLKTSTDDSNSVPAWHGGFTRKARTPRKKFPGADGGLAAKLPSPGDLVPELSGEFDVSTGSMDESDDIGLQCRVPVLDPFAEVGGCDLLGLGGGNGGTCDDELDIGLLLPSEVDLEEFAADVKSLLGKEGLDLDEETGTEVKVKDELSGDDIMLELGDDETAEGCNFEVAAAWEVAAEAAVGEMEFRSPVAAVGGDEVEEEKLVPAAAAGGDNKSSIHSNENEVKPTKMLLRLNYEDVITAWASHLSPWTNGTRPNLSPGDEWPDCMHNYGGDAMGLRGHSVGGDDKEREARVSRYREKRRTRMFSKKIRYQVRKLNAEKRPRMKGRFVKRTPCFS
ncbi:zinc finger protein CONSTANS-LIKE 8-like isoform X2 [Punica granatum]|uniref:Zinc finger protein CONSTANS-LIKE 8-like isoform X2 n=1 Tax=Punica granatum TaxID=22663 RepID=A0A6P8EQ53_PUNGR|nr:zinc finger protein CONSTANS-LIKE 8-like isoform X2 [Punica granatum]